MVETKIAVDVSLPTPEYPRLEERHTVGEMSRTYNREGVKQNVDRFEAIVISVLPVEIITWRNRLKTA